MNDLWKGMTMNVIKAFFVAALLIGGNAYAEEWVRIGPNEGDSFAYADKDSVRRDGEISRINVRSTEGYVITWEFDCKRNILLKKGQGLSIDNELWKSAFEIACKPFWKFW